MDGAGQPRSVDETNVKVASFPGGCSPSLTSLTSQRVPFRLSIYQSNGLNVQLNQSGVNRAQYLCTHLSLFVISFYFIYYILIFLFAQSLPPNSPQSVRQQSFSTTARPHECLLIVWIGKEERGTTKHTDWNRKTQGILVWHF